MSTSHLSLVRVLLLGICIGIALATIQPTVNAQPQSFPVNNANFNTPLGSRPAVLMLSVDVATACPSNVDITVTLEGSGETGSPQFAPGTWGPIYYPGDATKCGAENGKCGGTLSYSRVAGSEVSSLVFSGVDSVNPSRDSQDAVVPGWYRYFVAIPSNLVPLQIQGGTFMANNQPARFKATARTQQNNC